jgi:hypothetical protein
MASILQDLGIVEVVLADLPAFAAGQPIDTTISGYNVSVVHLPNGPTPPYVAITGSFFSMLIAVLGEYEAFAAGAPVSIAAKEGNTWYGITLTKPGPVAATPAT